MKRLAAVFLTLILVVAVPVPGALAHTLSTTAGFAITGSELTVRMMDVYGAAVEGGTTTAATAPPGGKHGTAVTLKETQPGTYQGMISPPAGDTYDLFVEFTFQEQLFRGDLRVKAGTDLPETLVPMVPIDPPQGFTWGTALYGAAVVVLLTATAVALVRRRRDEGAEVDEEE